MAAEGPSQGMNLGNAPGAYSDSFMVLNLMTGAAEWEYYDGTTGVILTEDQLALDEDGWLTALPVIEGAQSSIYTNAFYGDVMPAGQYILEWEGTGTLEVNYPYEVIGENRILITFDPSYVDENGQPQQDGLTVIMVSTDPGGTGDYIRDIQLYDAQYADLVEAGEVYHPDWYNGIDDYRILRTHDWQFTNAATAVEWDETVFSADRAVWGLEGYGMPCEELVSIANETRPDLWVTIPHTASDDYIRAAAEYLRDNVDPDLRVHIEFSNEYFTTIFDQYAYFQAGGAALGDVEYGAGQFYGGEAAAMTEIVDEVFAEEAERLRTVVSVDSAALSSGEALAVLTTPDTAGAASPLEAGVDVLATDGYLYWYAPDITDQMEGWMAEPDGGFDSAAAYLLEQLETSLIPEWEAGRAQADEYGLEFMIYEGGLLLLNDIDYAAADPALTEFAAAFAASEEAVQVYDAMIAA